MQNFGQSDTNNSVFYQSPALNLRLKVFTKLHDSSCKNTKFFSFWGGTSLLTRPTPLRASAQLEMFLIPNALCWSSRMYNCACTLPAEVQLRLRVTRRSWQKLFAGKNFVKLLVTAQTQLRSYSEQQRAFGKSNICNWRWRATKSFPPPLSKTDLCLCSKYATPECCPKIYQCLSLLHINNLYWLADDSIERATYL